MKVFKIKWYFLLFCVFIGSASISAQEESTDVREGNKLYKSEKFVDAEVAYRKGLQKIQNRSRVPTTLGMLFLNKKNIPKHWNNIKML